jgi:hypothetical protein
MAPYLRSRDFFVASQPRPASRAEPSRAEPSRAEPSRAEPSRAERSGAERSRAEPSRAEPSRAASKQSHSRGEKSQTQQKSSTDTIARRGFRSAIAREAPEGSFFYSKQAAGLTLHPNRQVWTAIYTHAQTDVQFELIIHPSRQVYSSS